MSSVNSLAPARPQLKLFSPDELAAADADWVDGLSPAMTLGKFGRDYVLRVVYAERRNSPHTAEILEKALALWEELTADRPLDQISDEDTASYIGGLYARRGRRAETLSAATVDKYRRAIQLCLSLAGPRQPRQRKAKGLIEHVPYIEPQDIPERDDPGNFSLAEIAAMRRAAARMTRPAEHDFQVNYRGQKRLIAGTGLPPAAWWDALLVFAFNTAERRGALFGLGLPDAQAESVTFAAAIRKGRRKSLTIPLNEPARAALKQALAVVRADRTRLFPWPHGKRHFYTLFHRLQDLAGIPPARQHGLHGIRKATATEVAAYSPMAGQLLLGHRDGTLLQRHYVNQSIKREALERLPQPGEGSGFRVQGSGGTSNESGDRESDLEAPQT